MKLEIIKKSPKLIVAISGTPGTGKTTVCNELKENGYHVIFLNDFIQKLKCRNKYDFRRRCYIVNINILKSKLKKYISKSNDNLFIIDSHFSYYFCDYSIILRTRPDILKKRLQKREYSVNKINENICAESLDAVLCNSYKIHKNVNRIFEIDTTNITIEELKNKCIYILNCLQNKKYKRNIDEFNPGTIDWIEYELKL